MVGNPTPRPYWSPDAPVVQADGAGVYELP